MPHMDGWEVLEKIANVPGINFDHFAIFILSSSVAETDMKRAESIPHVTGYLQKPLSLTALKVVIPR